MVMVVMVGYCNNGSIVVLPIVSVAVVMRIFSLLFSFLVVCVLLVLVVVLMLDVVALLLPTTTTNNNNTITTTTTFTTTFTSTFTPTLNTQHTLNYITLTNIKTVTLKRAVTTVVSPSPIQ